MGIPFVCLFVCVVVGEWAPQKFQEYFDSGPHGILYSSATVHSGDYNPSAVHNGSNTDVNCHQLQ